MLLLPLDLVGDRWAEPDAGSGLMHLQFAQGLCSMASCCGRNGRRLAAQAGLSQPSQLIAAIPAHPSSSQQSPCAPTPLANSHYLLAAPGWRRRHRQHLQHSMALGWTMLSTTQASRGQPLWLLWACSLGTRTGRSTPSKHVCFLASLQRGAAHACPLWPSLQTLSLSSHAPWPAGASQHAAAEDTSPEVAAALLSLNLEGPLGLARATLPRMVAQGRGQHLVVASMSGQLLHLAPALCAVPHGGASLVWVLLACNHRSWHSLGSIGHLLGGVAPCPLHAIPTSHPYAARLQPWCRRRGRRCMQLPRRGCAPTSIP